MNWLEFTAAMTGAVAWPAVVLIALIALRRSLLELLPGLHRLRYKDLELTFGRQVAEARGEIESHQHRAQVTTETPVGEDEYYRLLADVSPRAAILEAWLPFETLATRLAEARGLMSRGRPLQMPALIGGLKNESLLTDEEARAITRLRAIRNEVVHAPTVDLPSHEVLDYVRVLRGITSALEGRAA